MQSSAQASGKFAALKFPVVGGGSLVVKFSTLALEAGWRFFPKIEIQIPTATGLMGRFKAGRMGRD
jgi:hypothetical protein